MRKIIFINALSAKIGGGQTYIRNLLSNMSENKVKVYLVCSEHLPFPESKQITKLSSDFANINIIFRMVWEVFYLPILLYKLKVDIYFAPGGLDFNFFTFDVPKVTMFRNMLPFDSKAISLLSNRRSRLKNLILRSLMKWTMQSADGVIFISEYARKVILARFNIKQSVVIYHGVAEHFRPKQTNFESRKFMDFQPYLLYVSRFEEYKNHKKLILAYSFLSTDLQNKFTLVLAGEPMEPLFSECKLLVDRLGIGDRVKFIGKVEYESLPELYQNSYLTLFLSSCENCPNILLESIGSGSAVISSLSMPMPEFARDAAIYVDETDENCISKILILILNDDDAINKLKDKSIALSVKYSWSKSASLTWEFLGKVSRNV